jgi:hypothetical protein
MNYHHMNRGVQSVYLADDAMSYDFPDEAQGTITDPSIKTWDMTMKNVWQKYCNLRVKGTYVIILYKL